LAWLIAPGVYRRAGEKDTRDPSPCAKAAIKLAKADFFVSKLFVFSIAFCGKTKKVAASQDDVLA
jgi:hypothetical protein